MTEALPPLQRIDGYLPLEDHGLVGDGSTAALIGRDGAVSWLCVPRFDSPPLLCGLLDATRGGHFRISLRDVTGGRQYYEPDTGVLVTELQSANALVRVTDAMTFVDGASLLDEREMARGELLRKVEVLRGPAPVEIVLAPRQGTSELGVHLDSNLSLTGWATEVTLDEGTVAWVALRWRSQSDPATSDAVMDRTRRAWQAWSSYLQYDGPQRALVRRSALTLKLLDYFGNGAIVAAPTSSLPEAIGGPRNWDYRYSWIRDAAFSVDALRAIGLVDEARGFLHWALRAFARSGSPRVLYTVEGTPPEPEWTDPHLEGYRRSGPVRWGNAAADQIQHDVYGEIVDCASQWARLQGDITPELWAQLRPLIDAASLAWRSPDQGIWEVRTPGRVFTYSAAVCQVALERGASLAERFALEGDVAGWRKSADDIREVIIHESWDEDERMFTEHLGGGNADASMLTLPLRRVVPALHPRMVSTTSAIVRRLGAGNGLLYRYLPKQSPDGLPGHEGAFLLCSFWLVDNFTLQGRLDEAHALYDSLCARANAVGLLPEQIDPSTGAFLGNFPQAFSHVGVIQSGVRLAAAGRNP